MDCGPQTVIQSRLRLWIQSDRAIACLFPNSEKELLKSNRDPFIAQ